MSTKLLALAAELIDTNPAGAQLIASLNSAQTGDELTEALDAYDSEVLDGSTEEVDGSYYYVESPQLVEELVGSAA